MLNIVELNFMQLWSRGIIKSARKRNSKVDSVKSGPEMPLVGPDSRHLQAIGLKQSNHSE